MQVMVFDYVNKEGVQSTKIVAVVAETATHISGISLGHLHYKGDRNEFGQLKKAAKGFKTLDHLPKRGEGLIEFNSHYKCFNKSNIKLINKINLANLSAKSLSIIVDLKSK